MGSSRDLSDYRSQQVEPISEWSFSNLSDEELYSKPSKSTVKRHITLVMSREQSSLYGRKMADKDKTLSSLPSTRESKSAQDLQNYRQRALTARARAIERSERILDDNEARKIHRRRTPSDRDEELLVIRKLRLQGIKTALGIEGLYLQSMATDRNERVPFPPPPSPNTCTIIQRMKTR
ncbi:hypothetical protein Ciccas_010286 [Cichlidogyrus casuarinus]|uniref:Uncharacterized protein n=1 Tax=Cichlidogyrus casuarinus TaxID=1844966 RepID=A0ABD2PVC5_9PLAT